MPPGKLICCHHKNHCKWYHRTDKNKSYISKKDKSLAEKLAIKKYLSLHLEDLENERRAIEFYLRQQSPSGKAEELLTNTSEYQNLLAPYFTPLSKELSDWMHTPYEKNLLHPENLNTKSSSGNLVRSKSEMMIDTLLYLNKIPFRYECALHLNDTIIYPDFTIRHPKTGEFYYWEHFGLMDDSAYAQKACSKLRFYISHGIIPSIQLITTYETREHPLSTEIIEKIIERYFL